MRFCSKCGKEIHEDAEICIHCGCRVKKEPIINDNDGKNVVRFLLTFLMQILEKYPNQNQAFLNLLQYHYF